MLHLNQRAKLRSASKARKAKEARELAEANKRIFSAIKKTTRSDEIDDNLMDEEEWNEAFKNPFIRGRGKKRKADEEQEKESDLAVHLLQGFCQGAYNARQVVLMCQLALKDGARGSLLTQLAGTDSHNASRAVNQALIRIVGKDCFQPFVCDIPLKVEKHVTEEDEIASVIKDAYE